MGALNRNFCLSLMLGAFILVPAYPAAAGGADAKKHGDETIAEAEKMVDHGGQGHLDVMIKHAKA
ncbi:MAG TPA: hypothetical protein VIU33_03650, partial [Nitrospiria bacterium]